MARTFPPLLERVKGGAKLNPDTGCIEWRGCTNSQGYGVIRDGARRVFVHRVAYEAEKGPVPDGMLVCHRCDNPPCINVDHHFVGTIADNTADKVAKGRQAKGLGHGLRRSAHPLARLSESDVGEIRSRYRAGAKQTELADTFGVSQSQVSHIVNNKRWKERPCQA